MAFVLLFSIVFHEFAHSLTAILFGGQVRDITLQLLGGCAAITRMPPKPWQECVMALAGPLASFLLTAVFGWLSYALASEQPNYAAGIIYVEPNLWFGMAAMINFGLGCFNLIPAFPMDGGRVLRSLLETFGQRKVRATETAVRVGRVIASVWGITWLLDLLFGWTLPCPTGAPFFIAYFWSLLFGGGGFLLPLIAYMVWVSGQRELDYVRAETAYYGV